MKLEEKDQSGEGDFFFLVILHDEKNANVHKKCHLLLRIKLTNNKEIFQMYKSLSVPAHALLNSHAQSNFVISFDTRCLCTFFFLSLSNLPTSVEEKYVLSFLLFF